MAKKNTYVTERNRENNRKIENLIDELPAFCEDYFIGIEARTSPLTRLNYAYDLRAFFDYLIHERFSKKDSIKELTIDDMNCVSQMDIEHFLSYLTDYDTHSSRTSTCNEQAKSRKLSSIKSVFKFLYNKDLIDQDVSSKVSSPKLHEKPIIRLDKNEVSEMLDLVESGVGLSDKQKSLHEKTKVRDTAIVSLFLGTGIRISELVGLNNEDINFSDNSFLITRKGGNSAILYFPEEVGEAIAKYMAEKDENNKIPPTENALFLSLQNKRINVRTVENLVKKYAQVVTPLKHITPHKLRSTFGTSLYEETHDIYIVADVLGHKDVNTTKKHYAAISEEHRKSVAQIVKLRPAQNETEESSEEENNENKD